MQYPLNHTPSGADDDVSLQIDDDCVILRNQNTTIGYARFSKGVKRLDYIYVNPLFRRQGYGLKLIALAEERCDCRLSAAPPVSPLGQKLFSRSDSSERKR